MGRVVGKVVTAFWKTSRGLGSHPESLACEEEYPGGI